MDLNIRFQVASLCFFIIIVAEYIGSERLPIMSNKIFRTMLLVVAANLCFDMGTVFCLVNYQETPQWLVRLAHQLFIGSLDLFIALLCLYTIVCICDSSHFTKKKFIVIFLPFAVSIFCVIFGEIKYMVGHGNYYSYGFATYTVYISIGFYLFLTLYYLFRYGKEVEFRVKAAVSVSVAAQVFISVIQMINPSLLLSGLGIVIVIVFLFCSIANPKEYMEIETGLLNRHAMDIVLKDWSYTKKKFYIITIYIDETGKYSQLFGQEFAYKLLGNIGKTLTGHVNGKIFHSRTKCLSIMMCGNENQQEEIVNELADILDKGCRVDEMDIIFQYRMLKMSYPKQVNSIETIRKGIDHFIKKSGNQTKIISYNEEHFEIMNRSMKITKLLETAIREDGFQVVYQPIYSFEKKKFCSAEALVRLKDTKTMGFVSPEEFIGVAEKKGYINLIGQIVFQKVCQLLHRYNAESLGLDYIEVNLSALQCMEKSLAENYLKIMSDYNLSPKQFNFEITESAAVELNESIRNNINALIQAGSTFSMDDYGTGYSNLVTMADVSYDIIKLDKSIIWPYFEGNEKIQVLLPATIQMIKALNYHIVAEGVETKEQLDYLEKEGVDYIQGYYFSKPISEKEFIEFLKEHN